MWDHTIKGINNRKKPIMVRNTWNPAEPWTKRDCNCPTCLAFLIKWYNIDSLTFTLIKSIFFISVLCSLLRSLVFDKGNQVHECFITSISQIKVLSSICRLHLMFDWSIIRFQPRVHQVAYHGFHCRQNLLQLLIEFALHINRSIVIKRTVAVDIKYEIQGLHGHIRSSRLRTDVTQNFHNKDTNVLHHLLLVYIHENTTKCNRNYLICVNITLSHSNGAQASHYFNLHRLAASGSIGAA